MTSLRQIESNRRNAQRSTGPKTEGGKQRASRNAVRHGLTAETVIIPFEDVEDYQAFELAITADYDAETAVERELVLRLASLLWRLRRATSIETAFLHIQGEMLHQDLQPQPSTDPALVTVSRTDQFATGWSDRLQNNDNEHHTNCGADRLLKAPAASQAPDVRLEVAQCFLRLANLDNAVLERLGRYEAALWRQVRQTLFSLDALKFWKLGVRRKRIDHFGSDRTGT